jgi:hypothetical protein
VRVCVCASSHCVCVSVLYALYMCTCVEIPCIRVHTCMHVHASYACMLLQRGGRWGLEIGASANSFETRLHLRSQATYK